MKAFVRFLSLLGLLLAVGLAGPAQAAEPSQQFLDVLLANGYHEEAMAYLEQMSTSPLSSQEFKDSILYRQGAVLIQAARLDRDRSIRQRRLDDAQQKLTQFIQQFPQHAEVEAATDELAKISVENARILVQNAKNQTGNQQRESYAAAREKFDEAIAVYEQRLANIKAALEAMPQQLDENTQADLIETRDMLQDSYLRAMLTVPQLLFDKSETYEDDDPDRVASYEAARDKFDEMAKKYRRFAAGLTAKLWVGRCNYELADYAGSLDQFGDILDLPDDEPFLRSLRAHALHFSMKIWVESDAPDYFTAIEKGTELIDSIRSDQEERDVHWLAVRYYLALASKLEAESNAELTGNEKSALLARAKEQATAAARFDNPYSDVAQRLLAQLSGEVPEEDTPEDVEPTTFVEAKQFGDQATRDMQEAQLNANIFRQGPADPGDTEAAASMQTQLEQAEASIASRRARALYCYQRAVDLADAETDIAELNQVRYLLSFFLYAAERHWEAAVLAEYYARNCGTLSKSNALKSATIALACYQLIYSKARQDAAAAVSEDEQDPEPTPLELFAVGKVLSTADFIATTWPQEPEAQGALITLISFLVNQGDLEQAIEYLKLIPEDGSRRGEAELLLGDALWRRYKTGLRARREKDAGLPVTEDILSESQLEQSKQLAQQTLADGIQRMIEAQQPIDNTFASALLALTEIYVDTGQPLKAIELLEVPDYGLLVLVATEHPATQRQNYASSVYGAALRAYIAAVPEQANAADSDAMMLKASQVMAGLRTVIPDPRRLISLYINLAGDIKDQLDLVVEPEKKASLARAFETFLNQIAENSNDKSELIWVAESLLSVGQSFDPGPAQELPPTASQLYEKSVRQINRILDMQANGDLELDTQQELQLRVQLAGALRAMRQYRLAMNEYDAILSKSNGLLAIQIKAAQCYEDWVNSGIGVPWLYVVATRGGRWDSNRGERGDYTIWGWSGIARRTKEDPTYLETYYNATYHWASCYLKYAQSTDDDDAEVFLTRAASTISALDSQYLAPSISMTGGDMTPNQIEAREISGRWRPQFHELMIQVQQAQEAEDQSGLPLLEN